MFRSFIKTVSLMLLLVVIAASQTALFAEKESNSLYKNISLSDANGDTDTDDHESLLSSIQVADSDSRHVDQNILEQYFVDLSLYTLLTIRAPPYLYL